jgi:hypothetical protein
MLAVFGGPVFGCWDCELENRQARERFRQAVKAGEYDERGYRRAERKVKR